MDISNIASQTARLSGIMARATSVITNATDAVANKASLSGKRTDDQARSLALRWFAQMRAGQIDRTQLTADYSARLTDHAVQAMSRFLTAYEYGASPTDAQIVRRHAMGDQTFFVAKLHFPRGDAASLLFGFNGEGKITGISLMSMAGD